MDIRLDSFTLLSSSQEAQLNEELSIGHSPQLPLDGCWFPEDMPLDNDYLACHLGFTEDQKPFLDKKPFLNGVNRCSLDDPPLPVTATGILPSTVDFTGDYNFELCLPDVNNGKSWMYSPPLNKVFINIGKSLEVLFKWSPGPVSDLHVRALPVFMVSEFVPEVVTRCCHHASVTNPTNKDFDPYCLNHVVRAEQVEAAYCTDATSKRLSVVVPLGRPQEGTQHYAVRYRFVCKNSCNSGMNRRTTHLIFTLEDRLGKVLGRKVLQFRVCSCPKRDKDKEEADLKRKQLANPGTVLPGKRLARPDADNDTNKRARFANKIFQMPVLGEETYQEFLKLAHGKLLDAAAREKRDLTEKELQVQSQYLALIQW